jgi:hypothetical protein
VPPINNWTRGETRLDEALKMTGEITSLRKGFDPRQPRWPENSPDSKGGEFMRVGERFVRKGRVYEIASIQGGRVNAQIADGGNVPQELVLEKKEAEKLYPAKPQSISGQKALVVESRGTVVVDPYVDSTTHTPDFPTPEGWSDEEWARFGEEDQRQYLHVQERFGDWEDPWQARGFIEVLEQDYSQEARRAVESALRSQYSSSSGDTINLASMFDGEAPDVATAHYEEAKQLLRDTAEAIQWDLYNRTHSPDVSAIHTGSTDHSYEFFRENVPVMGGLSFATGFESSYNGGPELLILPIAIRHVEMHSHSGGVHVDLEDELEIATGSRLAIDEKRTVRMNINKLPLVVRTYLTDGLITDPMTGEMVANAAKALSDPSFQVPIGRQKTELSKTSGAGEAATPDLFDKKTMEAIGKAAFSQKYTPAEFRSTIVPAGKPLSALSLRAGDFIVGTELPIEERRFLIVDDPSDSTGLRAVPVQRVTDMDGEDGATKTAFSGSAEFGLSAREGGSYWFVKLDSHIQLPSYSPAFVPMSLAQREGLAPIAAPTFVGEMKDGTLIEVPIGYTGNLEIDPSEVFRVEANGLELDAYQDSDKTLVRSMTTGAVWKMNPLYKTEPLGVITSEVGSEPLYEDRGWGYRGLIGDQVIVYHDGINKVATITDTPGKKSPFSEPRVIVKFTNKNGVLGKNVTVSADNAHRIPASHDAPSEWAVGDQFSHAGKKHVVTSILADGSVKAKASGGKVQTFALKDKMIPIGRYADKGSRLTGDPDEWFMQSLPVGSKVSLGAGNFNGSDWGAVTWVKMDFNAWFSEREGAEQRDFDVSEDVALRTKSAPSEPDGAEAKVSIGGAKLRLDIDSSTHLRPADWSIGDKIKARELKVGELVSASPTKVRPQRVMQVSTDRKTVTLRNLETGEVSEVSGGRSVPLLVTKNFENSNEYSIASYREPVASGLPPVGELFLRSEKDSDWPYLVASKTKGFPTGTVLVDTKGALWTKGEDDELDRHWIPSYALDGAGNLVSSNSAGTGSDGLIADSPDAWNAFVEGVGAGDYQTFSDGDAASAYRLPAERVDGTRLDYAVISYPSTDGWGVGSKMQTESGKFYDDLTNSPPGTMIVQTNVKGNYVKQADGSWTGTDGGGFTAEQMSDMAKILAHTGEWKKRDPKVLVANLIGESIPSQQTLLLPSGTSVRVPTLGHKHGTATGAVHEQVWKKTDTGWRLDDADPGYAEEGTELSYQDFWSELSLTSEYAKVESSDSLIKPFDTLDLPDGSVIGIFEYGKYEEWEKGDDEWWEDGGASLTDEQWETHAKNTGLPYWTLVKRGEGEDAPEPEPAAEPQTPGAGVVFGSTVTLSGESPDDQEKMLDRASVGSTVTVEYADARSDVVFSRFESGKWMPQNGYSEEAIKEWSYSVPSKVIASLSDGMDGGSVTLRTGMAVERRDVFDGVPAGVGGENRVRFLDSMPKGSTIKIAGQAPFVKLSWDGGTWATEASDSVETKDLVDLVAAVPSSSEGDLRKGVVLKASPDSFFSDAQINVSVTEAFAIRLDALPAGSVVESNAEGQFLAGAELVGYAYRAEKLPDGKWSFVKNEWKGSVYEAGKLLDSRELSKEIPVDPSSKNLLPAELILPGEGSKLTFSADSLDALDALPVGTVLVDADEDSWRRTVNGWHIKTEFSTEFSELQVWPSAGIAGTIVSDSKELALRGRDDVLVPAREVSVGDGAISEMMTNAPAGTVFAPKNPDWGGGVTWTKGVKGTTVWTGSNGSVKQADELAQFVDAGDYSVAEWPIPEAALSSGEAAPFTSIPAVDGEGWQVIDFRNAMSELPSGSMIYDARSGTEFMKDAFETGGDDENWYIATNTEGELDDEPYSAEMLWHWYDGEDYNPAYSVTYWPGKVIVADPVIGSKMTAVPALINDAPAGAVLATDSGIKWIKKPLVMNGVISGIKDDQRWVSDSGVELDNEAMADYAPHTVWSWPSKDAIPALTLPVGENVYATPEIIDLAPEDAVLRNETGSEFRKLFTGQWEGADSILSSTEMADGNAYTVENWPYVVSEEKGIEQTNLLPAAGTLIQPVREFMTQAPIGTFLSGDANANLPPGSGSAWWKKVAPDSWVNNVDDPFSDADMAAMPEPFMVVDWPLTNPLSPAEALKAAATDKERVEILTNLPAGARLGPTPSGGYWEKRTAVGYGNEWSAFSVDGDWLDVTATSYELATDGAGGKFFLLPESGAGEISGVLVRKLTYSPIGSRVKIVTDDPFVSGSVMRFVKDADNTWVPSEGQDNVTSVELARRVEGALGASKLVWPNQSSWSLDKLASETSMESGSVAPTFSTGDKVKLRENVTATYPGGTTEAVAGGFYQVIAQPLANTPPSGAQTVNGWELDDLIAKNDGDTVVIGGITWTKSKPSGEFNQPSLWEPSGNTGPNDGDDLGNVELFNYASIVGVEGRATTTDSSVMVVADGKHPEGMVLAVSSLAAFIPGTPPALSPITAAELPTAKIQAFKNAKYKENVNTPVQRLSQGTIFTDKAKNKWMVKVPGLHPIVTDGTENYAADPTDLVRVEGDWASVDGSYSYGSKVGSVTELENAEVGQTVRFEGGDISWTKYDVMNKGEVWVLDGNEPLEKRLDSSAASSDELAQMQVSFPKGKAPFIDKAPPLVKKGKVGKLTVEDLDGLPAGTIVRSVHVEGLGDATITRFWRSNEALGDEWRLIYSSDWDREAWDAQQSPDHIPLGWPSEGIVLDATEVVIQESLEEGQ